jgi:capsular exopolysaccharide synthesis family protein
MSRVFEALSKANEAKKHQIVEALTKASEDEKYRNDRAFAPAGNRTIKSDDVVEIVEANQPWSIPRNGHERDVSELPIRVGNGQKSWRERIEELLFGWDLAKYHNYPIVALEKDSPESEQYKILREQIKRLRMEGGIDAFSITSPVKRDGKTTVAVNLAAVLALDYEENVLLIDGDLRAPGVNRYFNAPLSPGLADYLGSGSRLNIKSLVQETFLPGLRILPAGKPSHLSSELLAKEKMKLVMEEIRAEFPKHQIIIDTPPILSTPDPMVIARHVDGVLMVIRAGKTPRDYLTKALQSLNSSKIMGVVLNGANLGISSKYYYYTTNEA